jgi:ribosomal protein L30/L7E
MSEAKNDTLVAVVRIRGRVNVRSDITETLNRLHLKRVNNCAIIKQTPSLHGMIHKVENYVAYGEIDEPTLTKLLAKHAPRRSTPQGGARRQVRCGEDEGDDAL